RAAASGCICAAVWPNCSAVRFVRQASMARARASPFRSLGPRSRPMTRPYVLLVEDNAQNRYLATYLLESGGYEVGCVTTGLEAIEAIRGRRPDLVLIDILLPEMDGYELGRRLRA